MRIWTPVPESWFLCFCLAWGLVLTGGKAYRVNDQLNLTWDDLQ